jgi:hypothetical protein
MAQIRRPTTFTVVKERARLLGIEVVLDNFAGLYTFRKNGFEARVDGKDVNFLISEGTAEEADWFFFGLFSGMEGSHALPESIPHPSLDPLREALGTWVDEHPGSTDEGVIKATVQRLKLYEQQIEVRDRQIENYKAALASHVTVVGEKENLRQTFADRMDRELEQKYGKAQVCVDNGWD